MSRQQLLKLAVPLVVVGAAGLALAASTAFTEAFNAGHGWTYTQLTCPSGGCSNTASVTTDGNPANSVSATVSGNGGVQTGYFKKTFTWEQLGVSVGDTITSVDGKWDAKNARGTDCIAGSTMGMQIFDSANTTEVTGATLEPLIDVSGDAAWTTHNGSAAVSVVSSSASGNTVTLRFNINTQGKASSNPTCEIRGDNFSLTIVTGRHQVITSQLRLPGALSVR
jgi:hypothetical protein